MSTDHLIMRARHKKSVWNPGMLGVLIMTEDEIVFAPDDPMPPMELNEGFKKIKSYQYSKEESRLALLKLTHEESGDYIFEFYNSPERNVCRDFVGRVLGKLQAMQSSVQDTKVSEKPAVPICDEQLSTKEIQLRIKLLHENNELQKLHNQFVIGGMLTEAEFWAMRKTNKLTISLTPKIIHQMRRVDGTLDMEADEEDGYILLPVSGLLSDQSEVKGTVDETKQVIKTISTRKRAERTKAEDSDAEEWELLEAENELEEKVFNQVGRMGTLINKFKASFFPCINELTSYITSM